jgi:hypothetical protein
MVRFLHFFETGEGDYSRERAKWLDETKIRDIVKEIKKRRKRR